MTDEAIRDAIDHYSRNRSTMRPAISDWDVSRVTDFSELFAAVPDFDEDIGRWDTSRAVSMSGMFRGCTGFDSPIGTWDVSRVTDMSHMLAGALLRKRAFNRPLSGWRPARVRTFEGMFDGARAFNEGGSGGSGGSRRIEWTVPDARDVSNMFRGAESLDLVSIRLATGPDLASTAGMFAGAVAFNGAVVITDTAGVGQMAWARECSAALRASRSA